MSRVTDYKLNETGISKLKEAKKNLSDYQEKLLLSLPPSRQKAIVTTKLEDLSYSISRAIAEQDENHDGIITH